MDNTGDCKPMSVDSKTSSIKASTTQSKTESVDNDSEEVNREPSIAEQAELLASLPDEALMSHLKEQLAPFEYPKKCSVKVKKLTERDIKLFHRFLKVDSITALKKKFSRVRYTVKDSRLETELFSKKFEAICQELERVRTVLDNRKQWFSLYAEGVAVIEERAQIFKQIDELEEFIDANTPDDDDLDLEPNPNLEKILSDFIIRRDELFRTATGLRKKAVDIETSLKKLDLEKEPLDLQGVAFDTDETWMDDATRESLESLLAKRAADRQADIDAGREVDEDEGKLEALKERLEKSGSRLEQSDIDEILSTVGSAIADMEDREGADEIDDEVDADAT